MGGRIAEELFMDHMTTGAGNDIERATALARQMVCEWGMSDMGPLTFGKRDEEVFLGREIAQQRNYSEATAKQIDAQVGVIVKESYDRARKLIEDNSDGLTRIAEAPARARGAGRRRGQRPAGGTRAGTAGDSRTTG